LENAEKDLPAAKAALGGSTGRSAWSNPVSIMAT
jgi:hypothetical protein